MESLKELQPSLLGSFLFGGIELTILVGIVPLEQFGGLIAVGAGLGEEGVGGGDEVEGEQAKGKRATMSECCFHKGLNCDK